MKQVELDEVPNGIFYVLPPGSTGSLAEHPKVASILAQGEPVMVIPPEDRPRDEEASHEAP